MDGIIMMDRRSMMPSNTQQQDVQFMKKNSQIFAHLPKPTTRSSVSPKMTPSSSPTKSYQITPTTRDKILELQNYQSEELSKAMKELASKKHEVDSLRSKVMQLTTQRQEVELDQEILHHKFYHSAKTATAKEADLNSADEQLHLEMENLAKNMELRKKELNMNHQARMHQLTKTFEDRVDQTIRDKVRLIEEQKTILKTGITEQGNKIKMMDANTTAGKKRIVERYEDKLREVSDMITSAKSTLEEELQMLQENLKAAMDSSKNVEAAKAAAEAENTRLQKNVSELEHESNSISEKCGNLEAEYSDLQTESLHVDAKIREVESRTNFLKRSITEASDEFEIEEKKRRILNNKLQDLKGNIRVFCRVRPALKHEQLQPLTSLRFPMNIGDENQEHVVIQDAKILERTSSSRPIAKQFDFKFDKVFDMDSTNGDIFEEISPLVQSCINGYNICLFAYGQTGSGKTYTMSEANIGMIPRTVHQIFEEVTKLSNLKTSPWEYQITGKFLEIYNENLVDLISNSYDPNRKHEIRHDAVNKKTTVTGLTEVVLTGSEHVTEILEKANRNRSTASTKANERSSRSHSIFILNIIGRNKVNNEISEGTLNLIDLAGSERLSNSQVVGERLKETQSINKSLSALGDVISALGNKTNVNNHIPYRNSKLTYLLQYSLSGNSKTLMFVNVSPMASHFNETVNSLRFAMKVNNSQIC